MSRSPYSGASDEVPKYHAFMWPVLTALKDLGNSGTIQEIDDKTAEIMGLNDAQISELHGDGPRTEVAYRLAWARTYLKHGGAVTNTARGVWAMTPRGMNMSETEVAKIPALVRSIQYSRSGKSKSSTVCDDISEYVQPSSSNDNDSFSSTVLEEWRKVLLDAVLEMSPGNFERLCQRVLREEGFTKVEVTGKSGDGGIDGIGVLRVSLLSFHVYFQCKRYRGNVGAPAIRDFRGAMVGRTDKGLFITTGLFTPEAKREATRDGAPVLDLIDGEALATLLKKHGLGIETKQVEEVTIFKSWFTEL